MNIRRLVSAEYALGQVAVEFWPLTNAEVASNSSQRNVILIFESSVSSVHASGQARTGCTANARAGHIASQTCGSLCC